MKILLIRLDHVGDLMLMTPLIRAFSKAGNEVDLVTLRSLSVLFEGNPYLHQTHAIEDLASSWPRGWRPLIKWIRKQNYNVLLLPNPKPKQLLWYSLISGVPNRLAMQAGILGRITGHHCLRAGEAMLSGRHYSDLQLDFARALQIPTDGLKLDYFCREDEIAEARQAILKAFPGFKGEPLIGIHPGSLGNTCNLTAQVYGELAGLILERTDWRIILTGSAKENQLLDSWPAHVLKSDRVHNAMGGFTLRELAATISLMSDYVIGSTGPLHLAAALGISTTSPFCALPPIAGSVWGNVFTGTCVEPAATRCREWRQVDKNRLCDFRNDVTAESLWLSLQSKAPKARGEIPPRN